MGEQVQGTYAQVPNRIVDIGGWTDTEWAEYGCVTNLGVITRLYDQIKAEFIGVTVLVGKIKSDYISIRASDPAYNITATIADIEKPLQKNLLLANLHLIHQIQPLEPGLVIYVISPVLPGASMATSASVSCGILRATLEKDICDNRMEIALLGVSAEIDIMRGKSGAQDQFCASYGHGASFIDIIQFPGATCEEIIIPSQAKKALEKGLITVFYGQHNSSDVHKMVIEHLSGEGPDSPKLENLRVLAVNARDALKSGDLDVFGQIMKENTERQRELAGDLVCDKADSLIKHSKNFSVLGWKVNGAGGEGGSISFLFPSKENAAHFHQACLKKYPAECGYVYYEHKLSPSYLKSRPRRPRI